MLYRDYVVVLMSICLTSCSGAWQSSDLLKIASWNIRYAPELVTQEAIAESYPWHARVLGMGQMIEELDVTILATQEGNREQLSSLSKMIPNLEMVEDHRAWSHTFFPSFFINVELVTVLASGDLWLSNQPEVIDSKLPSSAWPRMLTWLFAEIEGHDGQWLLINVHLDGTDIGQVKILHQLVFDLVMKYKPNYTILCGDFNASLASETTGSIYQSLFSHFRKYHQPVTYNGHGKPKSGKDWDIDWILTSDSVPFSYQVNRSEHSAYRDLYLSDHDLIRLELAAIR
jgi:endonuclease/exonuclease/phosphatase family metal-dependent hydrolase